ncbi:MAG: TIM barrel protein [Planctomycetales bacterium]|nr:TIM barrel protein [Planctomycetales bacterium]
MTIHSQTSRRGFLRHSAAASAITLTAISLENRLGAADAVAGKGNINHSACKWCYPNVSLDELCTAGKEFGLTSVDLLRPNDFPTLKKHGMTCAMVSSPTAKGTDGKQVGGITRAWNRTEYHDALVEAYEKDIPTVANAGLTNLICFSGNRDGMDDELGLQNCAKGLKRIMPLAEKHNVVITMELLNSKVNHKDYMCDHTAWGVELCKAVGSENFKLLYDIYHMQIMEGDVIATIKSNHQYFSHYHTGGVPGRNEIDDTQELNYAAIARAIVATGFKGHVAQEFIPAREDKLASLRQGVEICDV